MTVPTASHVPGFPETSEAGPAVSARARCLLIAAAVAEIAVFLAVYRCFLDSGRAGRKFAAWAGDGPPWFQLTDQFDYLAASMRAVNNPAGIGPKTSLRESAQVLRDLALTWYPGLPKWAMERSVRGYVYRTLTVEVSPRVYGPLTKPKTWWDWLWGWNDTTAGLLCLCFIYSLQIGIGASCVAIVRAVRGAKGDPGTGWRRTRRLVGTGPMLILSGLAAFCAYELATSALYWVFCFYRDPEQWAVFRSHWSLGILGFLLACVLGIAHWVWGTVAEVVRWLVLTGAAVLLLIPGIVLLPTHALWCFLYGLVAG